MKKYGLLMGIIVLAMILCPLTVFMGEKDKNQKNDTSVEVTEEHKNEKIISVFNPIDKSVSQMSLRDYCIGAVAAEMPASYNIEALKAQAIVCLTYARNIKNNGGSGMKNADISADSSTYQGYLTIEDMKKKWGDGFNEYYKKTESAVDSVIDSVITYNGEIISAVFCAISSGKTENAKDVWGSDVPYLKSVDSSWDSYSPKYSNTIVYSSDRVKDALSKEKDVNLSGQESKWFSDVKKNSNGRIISLTLGGKKFTGDEIRGIFGLKSSNFTVSYDKGYFTFKTLGYGHGVGMSQYGANYMAQNGATYDEIIKHYYTGVEIETVDATSPQKIENKE